MARPWRRRVISGVGLVNKLITHQALDVTDFLSPINQPMADVSDERQQSEEPQGWLMRISESSYGAWRKHGARSFCLFWAKIMKSRGA